MDRLFTIYNFYCNHCATLTWWRGDHCPGRDNITDVVSKTSTVLKLSMDSIEFMVSKTLVVSKATHWFVSFRFRNHFESSHYFLFEAMIFVEKLGKYSGIVSKSWYIRQQNFVSRLYSIQKKIRFEIVFKFSPWFGNLCFGCLSHGSVVVSDDVSTVPCLCLWRQLCLWRCMTSLFLWSIYIIHVYSHDVIFVHFLFVRL